MGAARRSSASWRAAVVAGLGLGLLQGGRSFALRGVGLIAYEQLGRNRATSRLLATSPVSSSPAEQAVSSEVRGFPVNGLSLGAPRHRPGQTEYTTKGGVTVRCDVLEVKDPHAEVEALISALDSRKGVLLSSSYEYPGRYARWTLGFVDPPLELTGRGKEFRIRALNARGRILLPIFLQALKEDETGAVESVALTEEGGLIEGLVKEPSAYFKEEKRSKQPSLLSVVRIVVDLFSYGGDPQLGLYGAFGYDLTLQFDAIDLHQKRDPNQNDIALFLPDEILVVDQDKLDAWKIHYSFGIGTQSTSNAEGGGLVYPYTPASGPPPERDMQKGKYAEQVTRAREEFRVGNLFEVVLSQTFREACPDPPSEIFRRLRRRNPSPYGFLINLGDGEYLVGASPEMFVRCETTGDGLRVETCPISGTIARGANALEDARAVRALLSNPKEESELTMCTDVDRNDKSRICVPGSVRVLGRRQIEMYSKLIHTVDHVEGYLRPEFDALDAFLCHTWAVTVTGAPKRWAIQFIEEHEASQRAWYGGAVGLVGFDGHLNTGLTLRTVRVKNGIAEVRAGATLLYDSEPAAEEAETELKSSAMIDAVIRADPPAGASDSEEAFRSSIEVGSDKTVLLIDHQDSFVHTLGNYLRQTGADVSTVRCGKSSTALLQEMRDGERPKPDLVILSPGPGRPSDFDLSGTLAQLTEMRIPAFGVCLGLQGMVEFWGGKLSVLDYPMHGKPSAVRLEDRESHSRGVFDGMPNEFEVARYHSLYGLRSELPSVLRPTAVSEDGIVMAVEHTELPFAAVQFHPESILTDPRHGLRLLANCLNSLKYQ
jgi:anthranilate synthase